MSAKLRVLLCACAGLAAAAARGLRGAGGDAVLDARTDADVARKPWPLCSSNEKLLPKSFLTLKLNNNEPTATLQDWLAVSQLTGCVAFSKKALLDFLKYAIEAEGKQLQDWSAALPPTDVAFAAKVAFAEGTTVAIVGDVHGQLKELILELIAMRDNGILTENLRVKDSGAIIFTGDLLDRGKKSIEAFVVVLLLRLANPGRVFVARGNHECVLSPLTLSDTRAPLAHSLPFCRRLLSAEALLSRERNRSGLSMGSSEAVGAKWPS